MLLSIRFSGKKEIKNRAYSKWIIYLPIISIAIMLCLLLLPEIATVIHQQKVDIPVLSDLQYSEKFNIWLAFAITIFTMVGSYSTYLQVVSEQKRNRIEDARNELEKAFGPLFTILNYRARDEKESLKIRQTDFKKIDKIMAVYPWMFPKEINDLWSKTRSPIPSISVGELKAGQEEPLHNVSLEFRNKTNEEYNRRVKRYNQLLGKT